MLDTKVAELAKIFNCNNCDYCCRKQSDYNKHLMTNKHKMLDNAGSKVAKVAKVAKVVKAFICVCGREYKHNQSYYRHKKHCAYTDNDIIINNDNSNILNLISQNKELMNLLVLQNQEHREETNKLQNTILELVPKIGNNTTNNNQFNLQVFLNEDCKDALNFSEFLAQIQISFEDLENQAENGFIKGISKLFIESLQELGQNKRPIHCSDKKRKTIYIKEDNEWDKEGSLDILKKGINEVTRRTLQTLMKEKENNAEEYKDGDSEFSLKCLNIQRNLFPSAPRETTIGKVIENITQNSGIV